MPGLEVLKIRTAVAAQESLTDSLSNLPGAQWWFCGEHLFEVSIQPIHVGARNEDRIVGYLVLGYEVDDAVVRELSQVAASQVAFLYGDTLVRSTLSPLQETDLIQQAGRSLTDSRLEPKEIQLGQERFLATRVDLAPGVTSPGSQVSRTTMSPLSQCFPTTRASTGATSDSRLAMTQV